jgi:hypothetical protein
MSTSSLRVTILREIRLLAAAALLGMVLAACSQPAPGDDQEPPPAPSSDTLTPAAPPPSEPAPDAPADPAESEPVLAGQPALASMKSAKAPAKLTVPVDLRYSFDTAPLTNQPVVLHLAAVPRVAGTNLTVSVKAVEGIQLSSGALNVQKASANGAYRQQFSVTRQGTAPAELRVLVTMDLPQGSGFGFFSIPMDSVKQH